MFEPRLAGLGSDAYLFCKARLILPANGGSQIRSQIPTHYRFEAVYTSECMPGRQPMRRADSFMPIGQNTSFEELVEAAAIELDGLRPRDST